MIQLSRREFINLTASCTLLSILAPACASYSAALNKNKKMNVLFVVVDDLRPQLGCYGHKQMISPNIDKLASNGLLFERPYCQQAVCGPSRTSVLTGLRPDTSQVTNNNTYFRALNSNIVTLPQHFKSHGYHTESIGKVYHGAFAFNSQLHDPVSWSTPAWFPGPRYYYTEEGVADAKRIFKKSKAGEKASVDDWENHLIFGFSTEAPNVSDNILYDGQVADRAMQRMQAIKDQPFFMAVGFIKPHLPFVAPKKYWDLYGPADIQLPANPQFPRNVPEIALTNWSELRAYSDIPAKGDLNENIARRLIHGYYASVSYVDAQIGRVLNELERLKLKDNTVIVLWGDHGWKLGEHGMWSKHTNFENDVNAPLIIRVPRQKTAGLKTTALVEFVDIYPTLCQICGLSIPKSCEGTSMVPLLKEPEHKWKAYAFSQFPRQGGIMGRTMRTDRYRYTEWHKGKNKDIIARELYDHKIDTQENNNIADMSDCKQLVDNFSRILKENWR